MPWYKRELPGWLRGKESTCNARRPGFDPWGGKIPLEQGKTTHPSILAWRIPWTVSSMGKQRADTSERLSLHLITDSLSESQRIERWKEPWLLAHGSVTPWKIRLESFILSFDGVVPVKEGGEMDDRGWDGWMASWTRWTWVWASSGRCRRTEEPGVLRSTGLDTT